MDTTVTQTGAVVVAALRAAVYQETTIGQYQRTIGSLTDFVEEYCGIHTSALGVEFAALTTSPRTGRFSAQRRLAYGQLSVSVFDSYLRNGWWISRFANAVAVVDSRRLASSRR